MTIRPDKVWKLLSGKPTMAYAVMVSLALHGALAAAVIWAFSKPAEEIKTDKLLLELAGMVSNRQREESAPSAAASTPAPPKKNEPKKEIKKTPPVKQMKTIVADSPVQVVQQEEIATSSKSMESKKDSDLQKQQTLNSLNKDLEELKKYQAKITKKIKSNLVYPADARKRGYEGVAAVRFVVTESGMIQSGTLVIARSSGYPMLDTNALKSVRDSEPFERPPRTMPVEIDLGFSS